MPFAEIDDLAPGMILEFQTSYGDPLILEVGESKIAEGEAVCLGEKFGLSITAMRLPEARFQPVSGRNSRPG